MIEGERDNMIKVDLVTGFLGSGKTTFIKKYADHLIEQSLKISILENDYGAVNVDMLLLDELQGENCELEMVAGACDKDCHKRRLKTKLISLGMRGFDRVIVEPSGIFDIDEFFDILREEPLDRWYEIGSVITIADAGLENELSEASDYLLASQAASAGCIVLSRCQEVSQEDIANTTAHIERALEKFKCRKGQLNIIKKDWATLDDNDMKAIMNCGWEPASLEKLWFEQDEAYSSEYFLNMHMGAEQLKASAEKILTNPECGNVFRVKGFVPEGEQWVQLNAARRSVSLSRSAAGQEIIIVIGEKLCRERIEKIFSGEAQ